MSRAFVGSSGLVRYLRMLYAPGPKALKKSGMSQRTFSDYRGLKSYEIDFSKGVAFTTKSFRTT